MREHLNNHIAADLHQELRKHTAVAPERITIHQVGSRRMLVSTPFSDDNIVIRLNTTADPSEPIPAWRRQLHQSTLQIPDLDQRIIAGYRQPDQVSHPHDLRLYTPIHTVTMWIPPPSERTPTHIALADAIRNHTSKWTTAAREVVHALHTHTHLHRKTFYGDYARDQRGLELMRPTHHAHAHLT